MARPKPALKVDPSVVLTKAVLRAAELWQLNQEDLAALLGTSPATVTRIKKGRLITVESRTEWQLAALVVRIFRSLDSLCGGDSAKASLWLHAHNRHLSGVPVELMKTIKGMVNVAEYLDAMRGKV